MDRETIRQSFGEHEFIIKSYATAREARLIQQVYLKGAKVEIAGETSKITDFNPSVQYEVEKEMIAQLVISMDGTTDAITTRCDELQSDVYDELIAYLDALISKKKK